MKMTLACQMRQGTQKAAWAPTVRSPARLEQSCVQDAIKEAISAAFQCPSASADTLRLARFTGLLAELTEKALKSVMLQEDEEHGRYIDATLQHYTAQWHLSNGPAQVCASRQ